MALRSFLYPNRSHGSGFLFLKKTLLAAPNTLPFDERAALTEQRVVGYFEDLAAKIKGAGLKADYQVSDIPSAATELEELARYLTSPVVATESPPGAAE